MGTDSIRQIIAAARQHEQTTAALQEHFNHQLPLLGAQLWLPATGAARALVRFVEQYIEYVPEFIESVSQLSKERGLEQSVAPFLHMAEDFFLAPPRSLGESPGLIGLLDEAFLAQRLIEEVNDRHIRFRRMPLLPVDMTRANIIVHHLIGDARANRLNELVEQSAKLLVEHQHLFENFHAHDDETSVLDMWQGLPCLSRSASIDLRLPTVSFDQSTPS
jgi:hypothetical protein